jgi:hypothetical protein
VDSYPKLDRGRLRANMDWQNDRHCCIFPGRWVNWWVSDLYWAYLITPTNGKFTGSSRYGMPFLQCCRHTASEKRHAQRTKAFPKLHNRHFSHSGVKTLIYDRENYFISWIFKLSREFAVYILVFHSRKWCASCSRVWSQKSKLTRSADSATRSSSGYACNESPNSSKSDIANRCGRHWRFSTAHTLQLFHRHKRLLWFGTRRWHFTDCTRSDNGQPTSGRAWIGYLRHLLCLPLD